VTSFTDYDSETCSIARALALVGDRWSLLVLRDLANGVRRFDELVNHLGIARNVLSARLARLVDASVVERVAYQDNGARARHEYRLTSSGRELGVVLLAFLAWGDRHLADAQGPPALIRHADCGAPVRLTLRCDDGHDLDHRPRLRSEPGPGSRMRA
jgi:DNA-binding HxlR family transcriptional regulator